VKIAIKGDRDEPTGQRRAEAAPLPGILHQEGDLAGVVVVRDEVGEPDQPPVPGLGDKRHGVGR
jgi:hypothetical protein